LSAAGERRTFPAELKRLADPATEFPILRLTDPAVADCRLPAGFNRFVGRRGAFLLYTRDGNSVCRVEARTGVSTELAVSGAGAIDPRSVTMTPDERSAYWCEGESTLVQVNMSSGRKRTVYQAPQGWLLRGGMSLSEDGLFVTLVETSRENGGATRIRLITTVRGNATTVAESPDKASALSDPVIRPKRAGFLYSRGNGEIWLGTFDGSRNAKLRIPTTPGVAKCPQWSPDGRAVAYIWQPEGAALPLIRECVPDANEDKQVAPTTRFVAFGRNGDGSVFVGASGSVASPHVLLLLRTTRREFTLAEHKASNPALVTPVFSSNSQRVFFQTDRGEGKWAIYAMQVEKIVEDTEASSG
jgi:oligogalacturonide lyase